MIHKIVIPTPFAVGDVNAYLIKGDALSIVDVGPKTPEAFEAIKKGVKEAGYELSDIEQVILTHHHPDHAGWIEAFENARLLGHAYNDLWMKRDQDFFDYHDAFYMQRFIEEGVPEQYLHMVKKMKNTVVFMGEKPLDVVLSEGDELPGHPGWTVLETAGHAQSHLVFWNESTKTMIGGDHILANVSSNPLIEPPLDQNEARPLSLLQYNESLKKILTLPVNKIYTGHGAEVYNAHVLIEGRLRKQHERAMKVLTMMENGPKTVFGLTQELFPKVYERELGLTLSETIGQTDYLLSKGMISVKKEEGGILHYAKA